MLVPPWKFLGRSAAKGTDKEVAMVLCIGCDIAMEVDVMKMDSVARLFSLLFFCVYI